MDMKVFLEFVEDLCKTKSLNSKEFREKLVSCGAPSTGNATVTLLARSPLNTYRMFVIGLLSAAQKQSAKMDVTDRLTDTSKYTGAHKERFDEEGKGKGKEGRTDVADDSGYVKAYKGKDTYDKTHKPWSDYCLLFVFSIRLHVWKQFNTNTHT